LKNAKHDTTRCNILNAMIEAENDDVVWPKYNEQLKNIAEANLKKTPANGSGSNPIRRAFNTYLAVALNNIGFIYQSQGDIPKALEYFDRSLKIEEELGNKKGISTSLNNLGAICKNQGDIPRALEYLGKSLKIEEELGNKKGISTSLNNLGTIYYSKGDIPKALECYSKSLRNWEEIGEKKGIANSFYNLGFVYKNQGDIPKALEYYGKGLKISEEMGDKNGIANSLNNFGAIYKGQGDTAKALEYFVKTLKIKEEMGDKNGMAISLNNIGTIYRDQGDILKALEYFGKSLRIQEEIGDKRGIALALHNIGSIYYKRTFVEKTSAIKQKNYSQALEFYLRSMKVGKELGFPEIITDNALVLNQIYKATGKYQFALENYELYIKMRDSLNNESTRKASIKSQLKYEYEKQAAADSVAHAKESEIKNAELKRQEAEIKAKKNQQYALFGGLFLVMVFAGFMFNRFKVTQKQKGVIEHQKEIVEEQKHLVDEKQQEILDSIRYAKRIQLAQIPTEKRVASILKRMQGPD
jgi:tetratricopeptide (TPR) repeat protein